MIDQLDQIPWGPTGQVVFDRTYSRTKPDGSQENWFETIDRVVKGNTELVDATHIESGEAEKLTELMREFKILPAGRHLWASGVQGKQFLFNCHESGWGKDLADHFTFTFMRLMEGGGVGANYSSKYVSSYEIKRPLNVHIVCDKGHADYQVMYDAGYLSKDYDSEWDGSVSIEDSREGWAFDGLEDLLHTFSTTDDVKHVDRVYDVSRVRQKGARIKGFGGTSSGPYALAKMLIEIGDILNTAYDENDGRLTSLSAMEVDHSIADAVVSGGTRRSARMSMVHWADPDIFKFIACKRDTSKHWTTNISVEIDDEFVNLVRRTKVSKAQAERKELADRVYTAAITAMASVGEPGLWNHDLSNHGEPVEVICTNPCGEIALTEWENCNLGHINLSKYVGDHDGALEAHRLMARFLIRATFGDVTSERQAEVLAKQRRIGVGHFGFQGWLVKQGIRYSDSHRNPTIRRALTSFKKAVQEAAREYAFELRIPVPVKNTTMAPTGSTAKLSGDTEGAHAIFSRTFLRRIMFNRSRPVEAGQLEEFKTQGLHIEPSLYETSGDTFVVEFPTKELLVEQIETMGMDADYLVESQDEIALVDLLEVQAMYQTHYADNAVSFTVNVPAQQHQQAFMDDPANKFDSINIPAPTPDKIEEIRRTLTNVLPSLKGTTMMIDGSRPQAPYERITREHYESLSGGSVDSSYDEDCASGSCPVK